MNSTDRFRTLSLIRMFFAFAAGGLCFSSIIAQGEQAAAVASAAPVWKLKDLNGTEIGSEQLKGKIVVVDFWATWCGPCIGEIPGYIQLQKRYGAEGLVIVGISVDQKGPKQVRKFAEEKGMNYSLAMVDDSVLDAFGSIESIPTTFLIDRAGRVVHRKVGAKPHEEYEKLVVQALRQ